MAVFIPGAAPVQVANEAAKPTPSLTLQGLMYYAKSENTYWAINDAGSAWTQFDSGSSDTASGTITGVGSFDNNLSSADTDVQKALDTLDNKNNIEDGDISEAEGFMRKTGAGAYEAIKSNLGASTNPGVTDDSAAGYAVGSVWINTTLDEVFHAVDVSAGAAVWKDVSGISDLLEDTTPQLGGNLDANGKTIDGRVVATDGTKLDGIESSATADQTGAEIKTAYEAEANAYTDTKNTKLAGIETGATADQTGAEIKTAYEAEANAFTDTKNTKLTGIETAATADQTGAEIKTAYEAEANAYTDAKDTKLTGIETSATADQTGAEIKTAYEAEANAYTDTKNTKLDGIETAATADQTNDEIRNAGLQPWAIVATSKYTATPATSSTITMSDTSDFFVGGPLRYTDSGGPFYAVVTAIALNTTITIAGAALDTGDNITLLETAPATQVVILSLNVPGLYGDGVEADLLRDDSKNPFRWKGGKAFLVAFEASQTAVDTGTEPKLNVEINNAAVSTNDTNAGLQLGAANTWIKNSAVAISLTNYDINYDEELELSCTAAGGTGDAEDLSALLTLILER